MEVLQIRDIYFLFGIMLFFDKQAPIIISFFYYYIYMTVCSFSGVDVGVETGTNFPAET